MGDKMSEKIIINYSEEAELKITSWDCCDFCGCISEKIVYAKTEKHGKLKIWICEECIDRLSAFIKL